MTRYLIPLINNYHELSLNIAHQSFAAVANPYVTRSLTPLIPKFQEIRLLMTAVTGFYLSHRGFISH